VQKTLDFKSVWTTPTGNLIADAISNFKVNSAGKYTLKVENQRNHCSISKEIQVYENTKIPDFNIMAGRSSTVKTPSSNFAFRLIYRASIINGILLLEIKIQT
jgi:hypothetical protein